MHLRAIRDIETTGPYWSDKIKIMQGETIHTENSHKYTTGHIWGFSNRLGLKIEDIYTDSKRWYLLVHFKRLN